MSNTTNEADTLRLRTCRWDEEHRTLSGLRQTVFIEEQGVPKDIEWDGRDAACQHVLATLGDTPVGCARLMPDGKIGRMAVLPEYRSRGVGAALLAHLIDVARTSGLERVYVHAQQHAAPFYRRAGFEPHGGTFEEAGIPHVTMHLDTH